MMKLGRSVRVPHAVCTQCNKVVDGATCIGNDASPSPGDFTVCIYCGHLMAYTKRLRLRELTDAEMFQVAGDSRIVAMQRARKLLAEEVGPIIA